MGEEIEILRNKPRRGGGGGGHAYTHTYIPVSQAHNNVVAVNRPPTLRER